MFQLRIRSHSGGARGLHGGAAAHAAAASAAASRPSLLPRRDHGGAHASRLLALRRQRHRLRHVGSTSATFWWFWNVLMGSLRFGVSNSFFFL